MTVSTLDTIDNAQGQATRRLIRLYESATDEELAYGLSWYGQANDRARELADEFGYTTRQVAGVIAALSPQTSWPENLKRVRMLLETGDTYGFKLGRGRAQSILADVADPDEILGGPKVRAFFDNIVDPLNSTAVTIDTHAYSAAAGQVTTERMRKVLDRQGEYDRIADMYRSAARYLGVAPHVVQAVVWVVWRNRNALYRYQRVSPDETG